MTGIVLSGTLHVPAWVRDLESFRRWTVSPEYPDQGEIAYLDGVLWVDPNLEREAHNQIKTTITITAGGIVQARRLGRWYGDRMRLVHPAAGLSTEPDAVLVRQDTLQRQRVQLQQGKDSLELLGSPDLVLEVVSPTSVEKDTVLLLDLYHRAGVQEYWLVNPLGPALELVIHRWTAKRFVAVRPKRGWIRSEVLGLWVRLSEETDGLGLPVYTLATCESL